MKNPYRPHGTVHESFALNDRALKETIVKNLLGLIVSDRFGALVLSCNDMEMLSRSLTA